MGITLICKFFVVETIATVVFRFHLLIIHTLLGKDSYEDESVLLFYSQVSFSHLFMIKMYIIIAKVSLVQR